MLQILRVAGMRQSVALCIFTLGNACLSLRYSTTSSLERPVLLSAFALLMTGCCLILHTRLKTGEAVSAKRHLRHIAQGQARAESLYTIAVVIAIVARAFLFRHTLWWTQCTAPAVFTILPALLLAAEWAWPQHDYTPLASSERSPGPPQGIWSHLGSITKKRSGTRSRFPARHLALALSWAILVNRVLVLMDHTTGAVCPAGTLWPAAGLVQILGLGLDGAALFILGRLRRKTQPEEEKPGPGGRGGHLGEECLLAAATMLLLLLATSPFATTSVRELAASSSFRSLVVRDLFMDSFLATAVLLSGLILLAHMTPITLALIGGAAFLSVHHTFQTAHGYGASQSVSPTALVIAIFTIGFLAIMSHNTIRLETEVSRLSNFDKTQHKKRLIACLTMITLLFSINCVRSLLTPPHDPLPIIQSAQNAGNDWLFQAARSQTASDAAAAYKARYGMPPPPKFDDWHAFALKHKSPVIDTFDQIRADLLPFWGLPPAELRKRTSQLLAQRDLGIGGIRIRGGKVMLSPNTPGTHLWMLEAYKEMIEPFATSLPDMDVAFNLDDECRVAMPAAVLSQLREEGRRPLHLLTSSKANGHPLRGWFSKAADPPLDEAYLEKDHVDTSLSRFFSKKTPRLPLYDTYIAPTCPSDSAALQYKWWDGNVALPAAHGGITAAPPDLCDRPDLARMHGFLLSPASFVVTQEAMPIFSQSRVDGFNDILVPSPWNYVDKVGVDETTDMEWQLKQDTVFWRGSSSDGFAKGNSWPGFLRARLVNLAKALRSGLPSSRTSPSALPDIDISFVGNFTHCDPSDCRSEAATFHGHTQASGAPKIDFQEHWLYRHLIDVDGAGFSGRFLPFLRSHSTAYRATLFRTWYDERVKPWKHYVPLDVSLSGLWDVVWLVSKKLIVKQEDSELSLGERIAIDGHDWAAKALRKEDMQVYMFRLLLEWGRLVDDDREELGYDP
ncbi:hypothetical protein N0V93_003367 [Gnomoniopsis smithogilvyi]|uniref:Glycosyl transferase CAP10 domain-containing protein n=1 Tax=Gnomoniopsis smithogilvyi TaxID=1191159 RepID=A0A9W9CYJ3_9PEZI|nr:hypothetical protein N0V93_003367 [Gnomoniopsis smithogilvyi]